jgi:DNA replication and repair protein RecF
MHITHLSLTNFRNYGRLELDLPPGPILLHGANAQGKTNLLEAIFYLATSRSPIVDRDHQLINREATLSEEPVVVGRVIAQVVTAAGSRHVEMRLIREMGQNRIGGQRSFRRQALVDRRKVRLMDLLGNLRVVLFLPQDLQLITGPPSGRRRYLDITICQIDPIYCRTLSDYNKVLEQRNALLRQIAEGLGDLALLPVFDEKLVDLGSEIFLGRSAFLTDIGREAQRVHFEELTGHGETVRLSYLPRLQSSGTGRNGDVDAKVSAGTWLGENSSDVSMVRARFQESVLDARSTDIARGSTTVGPHRDDWRFWLNGLSLSSYGSRGQQRSAIMALKIAQIDWMTNKTGDSPILLLDEVLAELDDERRASLLGYVQRASQAILTGTDPGMFAPDFLRRSASLTVSDGRVTVD